MLTERLGGALDITGHCLGWWQFAASHGYDWDRVLVALNSAVDRRAVQASPPRWIANAWTQPEDLGVSVHTFGHGGCLSCLYLPDHAGVNEDEVVAVALGVQDRVREVRHMLTYESPLTPDFLVAVAAGLNIQPDALEPYVGGSIRRLYVEGLCGGSIVPMSRLYGPRAEMHVPVAHQSAIAGVLLAAALVADLISVELDHSRVTRLDVRRPIGAVTTQLFGQDQRGICLCRDVAYAGRHTEKFPRFSMIRTGSI